MIAGPKAVERVATCSARVPDARSRPRPRRCPRTTAAQPRSARSRPTSRAAAAEVGTFSGALTLDGKAPDGLGVVMLWPEKGVTKRTPKQRIIEQRDKEFAPHVMAVPVGSTVSFPNFDQIFHNVFSLSKPKAFDLGMYKNGETREWRRGRPEVPKPLGQLTGEYLVWTGLRGFW